MTIGAIAILRPPLEERLPIISTAVVIVIRIGIMVDVVVIIHLALISSRSIIPQLLVLVI